MGPICAMKGGQDLQKYVDLLIPGPAKLTLLQGEGPIHLAGSHCVDFFGFKDGAGESEDEDEATADEEDAEAEVAKEAGDEKSTPQRTRQHPLRRIVEARRGRPLLILPRALRRKRR